MEINIFPFLLEAFSYNKKIWRDIDILYESDKYNFYKLAKESELYNNPIITEGDIFKEEYSRKMLGILIKANNDGKIKETLIDLVKKGWTHIYKYVVNNDIININDFLLTYYSLNTLGSVNKLNTDLTVLYWLSNFLGKNVEDSNALTLLKETFVNRLRHYDKNDIINYNYENMESEFKEKALNLYKRLEEKYNIELLDYSKILENLSINNFIIYASFIADTEDLSLDCLFENIKYNKRDAIELLGLYYMLHRNQNTETAMDYYIFGMFLKNVLKAYKEVKRHFFENNKETMYLELQIQDDKIKTLTEENNVLKNTINSLKAEINNNRKDLENKYITEIKKLKKENEYLKDELTNWQKKDKELMALRELMFSMDKQENNISDEYDIDLNNVRGIIVGGHELWQKKMKEKLPNFIFINSEHFDKNLLLKVDIVLFMTNYLSHALYYKMINEVRKLNINIGYISRLNEDLAFKEIINQISRYNLSTTSTAKQ